MNCFIHWHAYVLLNYMPTYLNIYLYLYIWASLVAQKVKNPLVMRETWVDLWVGKIPWRRTWQPTPVFLA